MNPKSRMVIFTALILGLSAVLPGLSRAQDVAVNAPVAVKDKAKWLQVQASGQTFYLLASDFKKMGGKTQGPYCALYAKGGKQALPSPRLFKDANGKFFLSFKPPVFGNYATATVPQKKKTAKSANPANVDADVWALLANIPGTDKNKVLYAKVLQKLKTSNPEEFARLKAGGDQAINKFVADISSISKNLKKNKKTVNADNVYAAMAKTQPSAKPKPNKPAAAKKSKAAAGDDAAAKTKGKSKTNVPVVHGKPVETPGSDKGQGDEENLVVALNKLLIANPDVVGKDMAERFAEYMDKGEDGRFISDAVRNNPEELKRLKATPLAWVQKRVADKDSISVAELYFVLGAGDKSPAWAAGKPLLLKALTAKDTQRSRNFAEGMKPYAQKPCQSGKIDEWAYTFLTDAAQKAHAVLADARLKGELSGNILAQQPENAVPGSTGKGGPNLTGAAKSFDFDSLFVKGAVIGQNVYAPGDKVSRKISIKMYTVKENGQPVNKIGIFDVTYKGDVFGRKFPLNNGEATFALDDRVAGMPKYTLKLSPKLDGDTEITFGREGNATQMKTTLFALLRMRAEQAVKEGSTFEVNGKKMLVLGQGGARGGLLFFPSDLNERIQKGGDLTPDYVTEVNKRAPDGRGVLIGDGHKRPLGEVNGKFYNLEYNSELALFEPKECKKEELGVDDPDAPKPGAKPDKPGAKGLDAADEAAPEGSAKADSDIDWPKDSIKYERDMVGTGDWERNRDVYAGLDEELKDRFRVYTFIGKQNGKPAPKEFSGRHFMVVPEELSETRNVPVPTPTYLKGDKDAMVAIKNEVRGIGHYLGSSNKRATLYYDLKQKDDKAKEGASLFKQVGNVVDDAITISDALLLQDAMERAGYANKADREAAARNLKSALAKRTKDENYSIASLPGAMPRRLIVRIFGLGAITFWPKVEEQVREDGSGGGHENNEGPGHALDLMAGPGTEPIPESAQSVPAKDGVPADTVVLVKRDADKDPSAALFANDKEPGKATRWYIMFKLTIPAGKDKKQTVYRTGFLRVFARDKKEGPPFPGNVNLKGVAISGFPNNGELRYLISEDKKSGLWAAVKDKRMTSAEQTVKLKDNCIGPVIWWGMDRARAQKACEKNEL
ncbi:MAG TPA: hypothetical protein DEB40_02060 [Elusimicrobia bacterium]|nr:hypothetical protein [Elusimicrobiota bacterium]HBT60515.1 hypothetical protein [Elusimicrobiota bacterium]